MTDIESLYKRRNGKVLIEIKISSLMQIFNTFDPAPFYEKELDWDAEKYIVDTVNDFPKKTEFIIVIHVPKDCGEKSECRQIPDAIRNHFRYKAIAEERRFRQKIRLGRINLAVALLFLVFCLGVSYEIQLIGDGLFFTIIREVFTIAGWVAMWAPVTLFLYELYPIIQTRNLFDRISKIEIEMVQK